MNLAWPRKSPGYGLQCWLVPSWLCLPSEDINVVGRQYDVLGWPRVSLVIKSLVMPLTALFWLSSRLAQSLENDKTKKKGHYHVFHRKIFFFVYERDKEINEQKKLQYSFFFDKTFVFSKIAQKYINIMHQWHATKKQIEDAKSKQIFKPRSIAHTTPRKPQICFPSHLQINSLHLSFYPLPLHALLGQVLHVV